MLELYHDLRMQHTGWVQRIHATCFHQGATAVGPDGVVRGTVSGSAGGWTKMASMTQTRENPTTTDRRRETVEDW
jgi:hypothetical protein